MPKIKEGYARTELAKILGLSRQAIDARANKEGWPSKPRPGRGGGHLYPYASLPWSVQQVILARNFDLNEQVVAMHERKEEARKRDEITEQLIDFTERPKKLQDVALARAAILRAANKYIGISGLNRKAARSDFSRFFRERAAPGVEEAAYGLVKFISRGTLELWDKHFRAGGLPGLIPKISHGGRYTKLTPEMRLILRSCLALKPDASSAYLMAALRAALPDAEKIHKATLNRWRKKWREGNRAEDAMNRNPIEYKSRYQAAFGSLAGAPHAGHTWEMDSTPADVQTADGRRCCITAALDVYSRRAVVVVANTSNSLTVAACIRQGLLAWGRPEVIKKDNGADYSSRHITAITTGLSIETPKLPPYTPEAKGHIERFFHTLAHELEAMLPGFTGHSVAERSALRARNTWAKKIFERPQEREQAKRAIEIPLTQAELIHFIDCWLDVYENRPHAGFAGDPGRKLKGLTPCQAFETSPRRPQPMTGERMLDILLAPVGERQVGKRGISWQGGRYVAPELVPYIGQDIELRLHPQDAGAVYVFGPDKKFICVAYDRALEGQRLADYMAAKKNEMKRIKERIKAAWVLAETQDVRYPELLAAGRLAPAGLLADLKLLNPPPAPAEEGSILQLNPAFENQATREAAKAARAYDRPEEPSVREPLALPAPERPLIDFERAKREAAYAEYPNWHNIDERTALDPDYPKGKDASNPCFLFDYYVKLNKRGQLYEGLEQTLLRLWDEHSSVQKLYVRPDVEKLNIVPWPEHMDSLVMWLSQKRESAL